MSYIFIIQFNKNKNENKDKKFQTFIHWLIYFHSVWIIHNFIEERKHWACLMDDQCKAEFNDMLLFGIQWLSIEYHVGCVERLLA